MRAAVSSLLARPAQAEAPPPAEPQPEDPQPEDPQPEKPEDRASDR